MYERLLEFFNSQLGLLLVGALVAAVGLFTWQRWDWLYKEEYLRSQVLLDRSINLVERINSDIGTFVASAENAVQVIRKNAADDQIRQVITNYNTQQELWYGKTRLADQNLLAIYFPREIYEQFSRNIYTPSEEIDRAIYLYSTSRTEENYRKALDTTQSIRDQLQRWNSMVFRHLQQGSRASK